MAKFTREERQSAVIDAIGSLGGNPDLVALEQELARRGQRDYMRELMPMKQAHLLTITGRNENGTVVTRVSAVS